MIGNILVKIANRKSLDTLEQQKLDFWVVQRDNNNKFVVSIRDGTGTINCNQINAFSGSFRWQPYGLSSKVKFSATVPTGTIGVNVTFTESIYDELGGFTALTDTFEIKKYGWYEIALFCDWEQNSSGSRRFDITGTWGGIVLDTIHSSISAPLTFYKTVITRSLYNIPHDPIGITLVQNSGVDLTCTGTLRVQLLDKSPIFTD